MTDATRETDADLCRRMGWGPEAVLENERYRIRITAVGEVNVLARCVAWRDQANEWQSHDNGVEDKANIVDRDWTLVSQPPPPPDYGAAVERLRETIACVPASLDGASVVAWAAEIADSYAALLTVHAARPR